ncbi:hypothetical protein BS78_09G127900 [Paspalum vaginatum]|nr:hypothetical protein BS78_09G127900 [Paspalum vaginatum]
MAAGRIEAHPEGHRTGARLQRQQRRLLLAIPCCLEENHCRRGHGAMAVGRIEAHPKVIRLEQGCSANNGSSPARPSPDALSVRVLALAIRETLDHIGCFYSCVL